jgi:hypothetical protein
MAPLIKLNRRVGWSVQKIGALLKNHPMFEFVEERNIDVGHGVFRQLKVYRLKRV